MSAAQDFEQDVLNAITDPRSKIAVIAVFERWRGVTIYLALRRKNDRRRQAAINMLGNGMPAVDVCDALRKRFGISDRQARRDIESAKEWRGQMSKSDANRGPDDGASLTDHRSTKNAHKTS